MFKKFSIVCFCVFHCQIGAYCESNKYHIVDGELDLRNWNSDELVSLNGEWKFFWNQLLTAKDIHTYKHEYAQISIPWNEQEISKTQYPRNGYATYVLKILLPENLKTVSFWIPAVFNSSSFWVNNTRVAQSGSVGTTNANMVPMWRPQVVTVQVTSQTIYACFQISNFQGTRGGCAEIPKLSKAAQLRDTYQSDLITGKGVVFVFIIVAIGGIFVYYSVGANSYLALGFFASSFILRFLFSDLYLAYDLGLYLPWSVIVKLEYCSIPVIILSATFFLKLIYLKEFFSYASAFFNAVSILAVIVVILMPSALLSETLIVLQVTGLAFTVVVFITIIRALLRKRHGAWLTASSFACFACIAFYNISAFVFLLDLNRTIIHFGYMAALILSVISLHSRTPLQLREEELEVLRYEDFYRTKG